MEAAETIPSEAASAENRAPAPVAVPVRFRHIDSLRAVAALLVVWLHFAQFLGPVTGADPWALGFLQAVPKAIDVGRLGVVIFFAISGFVICRSFGGPREGAGRRFVVRRLCRLYPAYWVSMLGGVLWWWQTHRAVTWQTLAANATMVPMFLGQEPLGGVYWTLHVELIFYALCLCLHRTRWLERPATLAVVVVALTGLSRLLRIVDRANGPGPAVGRHLFVLGLAVMIWGALFRTVYDQTGGFRRGLRHHRGFWLVIGVALILPIVLDPKVGWYFAGQQAGLPPSHFAVAVGLWVFAVWVAWWRVDERVLAYLGTISYSIYLLHATVVLMVAQFLADHAAARTWNLPAWVYFLAAGGLTLGLSAVIYRWVEAPAIALGKRWAGTDLAPVRP